MIIVRPFGRYTDMVIDIAHITVCAFFALCIIISAVGIAAGLYLIIKA
jgi:hypothetical protein